MPSEVTTINANGIVKDIPTTEVPNEKWTDGNNIQFDNDITQKVLGHQQVFGGTTGSPYWILPFATPTANYWIYPSLTKIYRVTGSTHTDITRLTGGDYSATAAGGWNGGILGGVAILNNGVDVPQMLGTSDSNCSALTNWTAGMTAQCIRPFKQFLVALDTTESSNRKPFRVRWSHPADAGSVPSSWDDTDATKDTGYVDLSQTNGWVIDCLPLKDTNIVYKEDSVWGMSHEGGQSIFKFHEIFNDTGILGRRCVKAFDDKHFVVTTDDVYVHNGVQKESVIDKQMRDDLFNSIHSSYSQRTFVSPNYEQQEMWICFVSGSNTTDAFADKAFIWNWRNNTWSIRDLPNVSHIGWGVVDTVTTAATDWSETGVWDTDTATWDYRGYNPAQTTLLMADPTNNKFFEVGQTNQYDGTNFTAWVEKTGMDLGLRCIKTVQQICPNISGTGPVDFYIGSSLEGSITWHGPFSFTPGVNTHIPCRVTGLHFAIKAQTTNDKTWGINFIDIHWKKAGHRGVGV